MKTLHALMTMPTVLAPIVLAVACVIETVIVGDPGNTGDSQSQGTFGAVDYVYVIGKYEVTAAQYAEFLNAVAPNAAFFYLVRFQEGPVIGPWGFGSEGGERAGAGGCD